MAPPALALDVEIQRFAERLYGYLWVRFKVVCAEAGQAHQHHKNPIFTEAMGKAVLCEQLLMRRVLLRDIFFVWSSVIFSDLDSVYLFCQALFLNCITSWSYYKRFFRCCAVISEFYLYRSSLTDDNRLMGVERVFRTVFDDFFRTKWGTSGGWSGLDKFARERINPIYPRFETYLKNIIDPLDRNPPLIESFPISYEVDTRFVSHQARTYDLSSEVTEAFKKLSDIFVARQSEETINKFMNISLNENENTLPRSQPTERNYKNVYEASSTNQGKEEIDRPSKMVLDYPTEDKSTEKTLPGTEPIQLPQFVFTSPSPEDSPFSPIVKDIPSPNLPHTSTSAPIYKPKPRKSSAGSPLKKIRDRRSAVDSQPSEGSLRMDVSDADTVPTEELPQYPSRKRTISRSSSDENEGSKKSKK